MQSRTQIERQMQESHQIQESQKYRTNQVPTLSLFDLKAKKKTIPFKMFHRLPLTFQENMQLEFKKRSLEAIAKFNAGYYQTYQEPVLLKRNNRSQKGFNKMHRYQDHSRNNNQKLRFRTVNSNQWVKGRTNLKTSIGRDNQYALQSLIDQKKSREKQKTFQIIEECEKLMKRVVTTHRVGKVKKMSNKDYHRLLIKTDGFLRGHTITS